MIFNERLSALRKETGFTQKDFASKLDLEPSKYNKWENGKTVPDFDTVIKLARYLDVTVDYLIGNSDVRKWENADISERTGLSEEAIETLSGLKNVGRVKIKISKNKIAEGAQKLKKSFDCSKVDQIMNADNKDNFHYLFMLNKFIQSNDFYNIFSNFADYALDKTLLADYENWASEYLEEYLTDDFIEQYIGYKLESINPNEGEKKEIQKLTKQRILDKMTKELFKINLYNGDPEILSFIFYKKVEKMMDSIVESIESDARSTKMNQLRFMQITKKFDETFRERKFKLLLSEDDEDID